MELGMSTACFFGRSYTEDAVEKIGKMGIRHAEVFLCCASEYKIPFVKELKKRLDDNNIRAHSVHALSVQFEPQLFTGHDRARNDAYGVLEEILEAACVLEAKNYTFHGLANLKRAKKPIYNMEKIANSACCIAEKAKEYNVRLAWENVHWCILSDTAFLTGLLKQPLSDNLYFTLDIKQAAQANVLPEDFIKLMGKRLSTVHICDYFRDPERGVVTRLPFLGSLDFARLKSALQENNYEGPLIYEVYATDYGSEQSLKENFYKTREFFMA